MKYTSIIWVLAIGLSMLTACATQLKNSTTETVKIYGSCGMCKTTIEKAGNVKNVSKVNWNKETNMATLTYDATKTNQDEILKRIALSGYDSEKFRAPDAVYANLPSCCQFERAEKVAAVPVPSTMEMPMAEVEKEQPMVESPPIVEAEVAAPETPAVAAPKAEMPAMETPKIEAPKAETPKVEKPKPPVAPKPNKEIPPLKSVFDQYFALKDALVQTDATAAAAKAKSLLSSINTVKMDKLASEEHVVWMKVMKDLAADSKSISTASDVEKQRATFIRLSNNVYSLMKVSKTGTTTYYQFCPMANGGKGANWLSKEKTVKNPYYGSKMMSCGKVVETIK